MTPFTRSQLTALLMECGWPARLLDAWPEWQMQCSVRNRITTGELSEEAVARVVNGLHEQAEEELNKQHEAAQAAEDALSERTI